MMGPYYMLYLTLSLTFKIVQSVINILRLNVIVRVLDSLFGQFNIGLHDYRPKEISGKDSVCKAEIEHLANMVSFWWDKNGPAKIIHTFYQVRVPLVVDGLAATGRITKAEPENSNSLKGVKILDVGCGGGVLAEDLARLGAEVVGVDPGKEMINLAIQHLENESPDLKSNLSYLGSTVEEHAMKYANTYDAVVCSEVIEHVDEKEPILEACVKCLKPGGSLFVTTESKTILSWFLFIIVGEHILRFIPKGTHVLEKFITPQSLSKILDKYGCKTVNIRGLFYEPVINMWCFIDNQDVSYGLQAVKQ